LSRAATSIELDVHRAVSVNERIRMDELTDAGVVLTTVIVAFTARVVCEQTLVTWAHGVQMMEWSPPRFGLDWIGACCVILGILWVLTVVVLSVIRRERISTTNRWSIALILVCSGLWLVPYEEWKLLWVRAHGAQHIPKSWAVRAAALGESRLLNYLLSNGVDVNTRTSSGQPLGAAAAAGRIAAARLLLARGAYLENRTIISQETPLTEAAQMNHSNLVKLLLDHGADTKARDVMGFTALDWAKHNSNAEMVQLIQGRIK
jgi:hypothetical protein